MKTAIKGFSKVALKWQFIFGVLSIILALLPGCDQKNQDLSSFGYAVRIANPEAINQEKQLPLLKQVLNPAFSIQELLSQPPAQQKLTVDELVKIGSPHAVQVVMAFIAALPEGDFKEDLVRRALAINNRESIPSILELLRSTTDASVLRVSREVFSKLVDAESLQKVVDTYDATSDSKLRRRLALSVSMLASENVAPLLMQVVSDPGVPASDGMVSASAQALRQIGTAPAVDAIIGRINSDASAESRALLSAELRQVVNPAAEASLQSAAMGQSKFAVTPEARVAAISALFNFPSAETQESLKHLQTTEDLEISLAASNTLQAIEARLAAR